MRDIAAAAAALIILAGCQSATAPAPADTDVRVLTAAPALARTAAGEYPLIHFTVTNATADTIYVSRCGHTPSSEVLRFDGSEWVQTSSAMCLTHLDMSAIALAPSATVAGERAVGGPGRHRLRVAFRTHRMSEPVWHSLSNEFVIE